MNVAGNPADIQIVIGADVTETTSRIQEDLGRIEKKLDDIKIGAVLDPKKIDTSKIRNSVQDYFDRNPIDIDITVRINNVRFVDADDIDSKIKSVVKPIKRDEIINVKGDTSGLNKISKQLNDLYTIIDAAVSKADQLVKTSNLILANIESAMNKSATATVKKSKEQVEQVNKQVDALKKLEEETDKAQQKTDKLARSQGQVKKKGSTQKADTSEPVQNVRAKLAGESAKQQAYRNTAKAAEESAERQVQAEQDTQAEIRKTIGLREEEAKAAEKASKAQEKANKPTRKRTKELTAADQSKQMVQAQNTKTQAAQDLSKSITKEAESTEKATKAMEDNRGALQAATKAEEDKKKAANSLTDALNKQSKAADAVSAKISKTTKQSQKAALDTQKQIAKQTQAAAQQQKQLSEDKAKKKEEENAAFKNSLQQKYIASAEESTRQAQKSIEMQDQQTAAIVRTTKALETFDIVKRKTAKRLTDISGNGEVQPKEQLDNALDKYRSTINKNPRLAKAYSTSLDYTYQDGVITELVSYIRDVQDGVISEAQAIQKMMSRVKSQFSQHYLGGPNRNANEVNGNKAMTHLANMLYDKLPPTFTNEGADTGDGMVYLQTNIKNVKALMIEYQALYDYIVSTGTEEQKEIFNVNAGFEAFSETLSNIIRQFGDLASVSTKALSGINFKDDKRQVWNDNGPNKKYLLYNKYQLGKYRKEETERDRKQILKSELDAIAGSDYISIDDIDKLLAAKQPSWKKKALLSLRRTRVSNAISGISDEDNDKFSLVEYNNQMAQLDKQGDQYWQEQTKGLEVYESKLQRVADFYKSDLAQILFGNVKAARFGFYEDNGRSIDRMIFKIEELEKRYKGAKEAKEALLYAQSRNNTGASVYESRLGSETGKVLAERPDIIPLYKKAISLAKETEQIYQINAMIGAIGTSWHGDKESIGNILSRALKTGSSFKGVPYQIKMPAGEQSLQVQKLLLDFLNDTGEQNPNVKTVFDYALEKCNEVQLAFLSADKTLESFKRSLYSYMRYGSDMVKIPTAEDLQKAISKTEHLKDRNKMVGEREILSKANELGVGYRGTNRLELSLGEILKLQDSVQSNEAKDIIERVINERLGDSRLLDNKKLLDFVGFDIETDVTAMKNFARLGDGAQEVTESVSKANNALAESAQTVQAIAQPIETVVQKENELAKSAEESTTKLAEEVSAIQAVGTASESAEAKVAALNVEVAKATQATAMPAPAVKTPEPAIPATPSPAPIEAPAPAIAALQQVEENQPNVDAAVVASQDQVQAELQQTAEAATQAALAISREQEKAKYDTAWNKLIALDKDDNILPGLLRSSPEIEDKLTFIMNKLADQPMLDELLNRLYDFIYRYRNNFDFINNRVLSDLVDNSNIDNSKPLAISLPAVEKFNTEVLDAAYVLTDFKEKINNNVFTFDEYIDHLSGYDPSDMKVKSLGVGKGKEEEKFKKIMLGNGMVRELSQEESKSLTGNELVNAYELVSDKIEQLKEDLLEAKKKHDEIKRQYNQLVKDAKKINGLSVNNKNGLTLTGGLSLLEAVANKNYSPYNTDMLMEFVDEQRYKMREEFAEFKKGIGWYTSPLSSGASKSESGNLIVLPNQVGSDKWNTSDVNSNWMSLLKLAQPSDMQSLQSMIAKNGEGLKSFAYLLNMAETQDDYKDLLASLKNYEATDEGDSKLVSDLLQMIRQKVQSELENTYIIIKQANEFENEVYSVMLKLDDAFKEQDEYTKEELAKIIFPDSMSDWPYISSLKALNKAIFNQHGPYGLISMGLIKSKNNRMSYGPKAINNGKTYSARYANDKELYDALGPFETDDDMLEELGIKLYSSVNPSRRGLIGSYGQFQTLLKNLDNLDGYYLKERPEAVEIIKEIIINALKKAEEANIRSLGDQIKNVSLDELGPSDTAKSYIADSLLQQKKIAEPSSNTAEVVKELTAAEEEQATTTNALAAAQDNLQKELEETRSEEEQTNALINTLQGVENQDKWNALLGVAQPGDAQALNAMIGMNGEGLRAFLYGLEEASTNEDYENLLQTLVGYTPSDMGDAMLAQRVFDTIYSKVQERLERGELILKTADEYSATMYDLMENVDEQIRLNGGKRAGWRSLGQEVSPSNYWGLEKRGILNIGKKYISYGPNGILNGKTYTDRNSENRMLSTALNELQEYINNNTDMRGSPYNASYTGSYSDFSNLLDYINEIINYVEGLGFGENQVDAYKLLRDRIIELMSVVQQKEEQFKEYLRDAIATTDLKALNPNGEFKPVVTNAVNASTETASNANKTEASMNQLTEAETQQAAATDALARSHDNLQRELAETTESATNATTAIASGNTKRKFGQQTSNPNTDKMWDALLFTSSDEERAIIKSIVERGGIGAKALGAWITNGKTQNFKSLREILPGYSDTDLGDEMLAQRIMSLLPELIGTVGPENSDIESVYPIVKAIEDIMDEVERKNYYGKKITTSSKYSIDLLGKLKSNPKVSEILGLTKDNTTYQVNEILKRFIDQMIDQGNNLVSFDTTNNTFSPGKRMFSKVKEDGRSVQKSYSQINEDEYELSRSIGFLQNELIELGANLDIKERKIYGTLGELEDLRARLEAFKIPDDQIGSEMEKAIATVKYALDSSIDSLKASRQKAYAKMNKTMNKKSIFPRQGIFDLYGIGAPGSKYAISDTSTKSTEPASQSDTNTNALTSAEQSLIATTNELSTAQDNLQKELAETAATADQTAEALTAVSGATGLTALPGDTTKTESNQAAIATETEAKTENVAATEDLVRAESELAISKPVEVIKEETQAIAQETEVIKEETIAVKELSAAQEELNKRYPNGNITPELEKQVDNMLNHIQEEWIVVNDRLGYTSEFPTNTRSNLKSQMLASMTQIDGDPRIYLDTVGTALNNARTFLELHDLILNIGQSAIDIGNNGVEYGLAKLLSNLRAEIGSSIKPAQTLNRVLADLLNLVGKVMKQHKANIVKNGSAKSDTYKVMTGDLIDWLEGDYRFNAIKGIEEISPPSHAIDYLISPFSSPSPGRPIVYNEEQDTFELAVEDIKSNVKYLKEAEKEAKAAIKGYTEFVNAVNDNEGRLRFDDEGMLPASPNDLHYIAEKLHVSSKAGSKYRPYMQKLYDEHKEATKEIYDEYITIKPYRDTFPELEAPTAQIQNQTAVLEANAQAQNEDAAASENLAEAMHEVAASASEAAAAIAGVTSQPPAQTPAVTSPPTPPAITPPPEVTTPAVTQVATPVDQTVASMQALKETTDSAAESASTLVQSMDTTRATNNISQLNEQLEKTVFRLWDIADVFSENGYRGMTLPKLTDEYTKLNHFGELTQQELMDAITGVNTTANAKVFNIRTVRSGTETHISTTVDQIITGLQNMIVQLFVQRMKELGSGEIDGDIIPELKAVVADRTDELVDYANSEYESDIVTFTSDIARARDLSQLNGALREFTNPPAIETTPKPTPVESSAEPQITAPTENPAVLMLEKLTKSATGAAEALNPLDVALITLAKQSYQTDKALMKNVIDKGTDSLDFKILALSALNMRGPQESEEILWSLQNGYDPRGQYDFPELMYKELVSFIKGARPDESYDSIDKMIADAFAKLESSDFYKNYVPSELLKRILTDQSAIDDAKNIAYNGKGFANIDTFSVNRAYINSINGMKQGLEVIDELNRFMATGAFNSNGHYKETRAVEISDLIGSIMSVVLNGRKAQYSIDDFNKAYPLSGGEINYSMPYFISELGKHTGAIDYDVSNFMNPIKVDIEKLINVFINSVIEAFRSAIDYNYSIKAGVYGSDLDFTEISEDIIEQVETGLMEALAIDLHGDKNSALRIKTMSANLFNNIGTKGLADATTYIEDVKSRYALTSGTESESTSQVAQSAQVAKKAIDQETQAINANAIATSGATGANDQVASSFTSVSAEAQSAATALNAASAAMLALPSASPTTAAWQQVMANTARDQSALDLGLIKPPTPPTLPAITAPVESAQQQVAQIADQSPALEAEATAMASIGNAAQATAQKADQAAAAIANVASQQEHLNQTAQQAQTQAAKATPLPSPAQQQPSAPIALPPASEPTPTVTTSFGSSAEIDSAKAQAAQELSRILDLEAASFNAVSATASTNAGVLREATTAENEKKMAADALTESLNKEAAAAGNAAAQMRAEVNMINRIVQLKTTANEASQANGTNTQAVAQAVNEATTTPHTPITILPVVSQEQIAQIKAEIEIGLKSINLNIIDGFEDRLYQAIDNAVKKAGANLTLDLHDVKLSNEAIANLRKQLDQVPTGVTGADVKGEAQQQEEKDPNYNSEFDDATRLANMWTRINQAVTDTSNMINSDLFGNISDQTRAQLQELNNEFIEIQRQRDEIHQLVSAKNISALSENYQIFDMDSLEAYINDLEAQLRSIFNRVWNVAGEANPIVGQFPEQFEATKENLESLKPIIDQIGMLLSQNGEGKYNLDAQQVEQLRTAITLYSQLKQSLEAASTASYQDAEAARDQASAYQLLINQLRERTETLRQNIGFDSLEVLQEQQLSILKSRARSLQGKFSDLSTKDFGLPLDENGGNSAQEAAIAELSELIRQIDSNRNKIFESEEDLNAYVRDVRMTIAQLNTAYDELFKTTAKYSGMKKEATAANDREYATAGIREIRDEIVKMIGELSNLQFETIPGGTGDQFASLSERANAFIETINQLSERTDVGSKEFINLYEAAQQAGNELLREVSVFYETETALRKVTKATSDASNGLTSEEALERTTAKNAYAKEFQARVRAQERQVGTFRTAVEGRKSRVTEETSPEELEIIKAEEAKIEELTQRIERLRLEINQLKKVDIGTMGLEDIRKLADNINAEIDELTARVQTVNNNMREKNGAIGQEVEIKAERDLYVESLNQDVAEAKSYIDSINTNGLAPQLVDQVNELRRSLELVTIRLQEFAKEKVNAFTASNSVDLNYDYLKHEIDGIITSAMDLKSAFGQNGLGAIGEVTHRIDEMLHSLIVSGSTNEELTALTNFMSEYEAFLGRVREATANVGKADAGVEINNITKLQADANELEEKLLRIDDMINGFSKRDALITQANGLLVRMTKAQEEYASPKTENTIEYKNIQNYIDELSNLIAKYRENEVSTESFKQHLESLNQCFSTSMRSVEAASKGMGTLATSFGNFIKKFSYWFSASRIIMSVIRNIRQMITNVISLEDSMTQLKIVTQENDAVYANYSATIAEAAKSIGVSINDLVDATTVYARLGYDLNESTELARVTGMLQNVGK